MPTVNMSDAEFREYQITSNRKKLEVEVAAKLKDFKVSLFNYISPLSSPAGYYRIVTDPEPEYWRAQLATVKLQTPFGLLKIPGEMFMKSDPKVLGWVVAQWWGIVHISRAIRSVHPYTHKEWSEDTAEMWNRLGTHISKWGVWGD